MLRKKSQGQSLVAEADAAGVRAATAAPAAEASPEKVLMIINRSDREILSAVRQAREQLELQIEPLLVSCLHGVAIDKKGIGGAADFVRHRELVQEPGRLFDKRLLTRQYIFLGAD